MKKGIALLIVFLTIYSIENVQGQDEKIDSLRKVYKQTIHDTTRIKTCFNIGDFFKYEVPDSALFYYQKTVNLANKVLPDSSITHPQQLQYNTQSSRKIALYNANALRNIGVIHKNKGNYDMAVGYYQKSLNIAEKLDDRNGMAANYNNIANVLVYLGNYNKAIEYYLKCKQIDEEQEYKLGMASGHNNIGNVYSYQGNYKKAIEYYLKSLKIYEELQDKAGMAICYNNIGIIHSDQQNYDKAREYYLKSLEIEEELQDKKGMSASYINIGADYADQGNYNMALDYYLKALKIDKEVQNNKGLGVCYNYIGNLHTDQGSYDKAIDYYMKSLKIKVELKEKHGIANIYGSLAALYIRLADSTAQIDRDSWTELLGSALNYGHKSYDIAIEIGAIPTQNDAAAQLQKAYAKLGLFEKAIKYAEIYIATQDSMFSEEKTKALTEMEAKFESEKKQLQIEKMEQQKELDDITIEAQQAENHKQQIMIFSAVGAFLTILVFSLIILGMLRQKRKANLLLATQNDEIKKQKEQIEEQNRSITDSIVYAQRIQRALLPPGDYMKQLLPYRFILYKPRDIVSGDFYWVSKKDNLIVTAAADCTGHGVPGAMMSMLGVSILNEIVNSMQKLDAGEILNSLRSKLIESLHQGGEESHMWDGIDIALCLIDLEMNELQFAGANCPLYLIRDSELMEIKGDKMPIGIHARMEPFSRQLIKTQKDDMFYMFSDGYIDQFGGENDKRFTRRRFKELLLGVHNESMKDQKEGLEKAFDHWKGKTEQVDDILVMGIKI